MLAILQKFKKKNRKIKGWPFFNLFGEGDAAFIFYAHVRAFSHSYTDEE